MSAFETICKNVCPGKSNVCLQHMCTMLAFCHTGSCFNVFLFVLPTAEIASERLSGAQFASSLARLGGVDYPIQLLVSLFTATARTKATLCSSARASHSLGAPRSRRGAFADRDAFQQLLGGHTEGGLVGISAVIGKHFAVKIPGVHSRRAGIRSNPQCRTWTLYHQVYTSY
jgi:hypothetical protein